MKLKIYGERNTGTNYLEQLLLVNLAHLPRDIQGKIQYISSPTGDIISPEESAQHLGWKHRLLEPSFLQALHIKQEDIRIVTLTKNPYSWLLSLHKRPYNVVSARTQVMRQNEHGLFIPPSPSRIRVMRFLNRWRSKTFTCWDKYQKLTFQQFLHAAWFTVPHEGSSNIEHPMALWNQKNAAYLNVAKYYPVLLCTYEQLLATPEATVRRIFLSLGVTLKKFENIAQSTKKTDRAQKDHGYYYNYYLNEEWRRKLTPHDIARITTQLDPQVMNAFQYLPLSLSNRVTYP